MNFATLKMWMIAGAIALGGGTAALAATDVELSATEGIVLQEEGTAFQFGAAGEGIARRGRGQAGEAGQGLGLSEEARTFLRDEVKAVTAETLGVTVEELEAADREARAALIEASGLTMEEVQAAVESAWPGIIQEAADSGLITAEQATALTEAGPSIGGRGGRRGGRGGHGAGGRGEAGLLPAEARTSITAEALGITVEELEAYQADGLRTNEIIAELGLDREEVRDAAQEATAAAIEQAAADGTITQEQADNFLELLALRDVALEIREQATLQVLGITADELEAYKESGLSRSEILTELGLDAETVRTEMQAAMETLVQEAIDAGTITEEQGNIILNGRGNRGNRGPGKFNNGNGDAAPADTAPTETSNNA